MQGLMRLLCLGYLIFLTVLLLVADPLCLMRVRGEAAGNPQDDPAGLVHLLAFELADVDFLRSLAGAALDDSVGVGRLCGID